MNREASNPTFPLRRSVVLACFVAAAGVLLWRVVDLQVYKKEFLQRQGDVRHLRVVTMPAHRGMITDRNGDALAVSTPVASLWINPRDFVYNGSKTLKLERLLGLQRGAVKALVEKRKDREFVYLKRRITPELADQALDLEIPGLNRQAEFRRYYPAGPVTAHVVGFTNIDDKGQEGLELAYDEWLRGTTGAKRVLKDRLGRTIENVENIRSPRPGRDLKLSLDRRIQYLAHRELAAAVERHKAKGGSVVILDTVSGEVLAMANQPDYNPNNRHGLKVGRFRNRAVTDLFEPGSTIKPFTITCGLESGDYTTESHIDTAPGYFTVAGFTIKDHRNYGDIDLTTVLRKSSNVAASKIALSEPPRCLWSVLRRVGFGDTTGSAFPGEAQGLLAHYETWRPIHQATLAYGYGLSATALQLADAYAVLAADGVKRPLSFVAVERPVEGERVIDAEVARKVRTMLEAVVAPDGTGRRAAIPGYRVAGKTGTAHKPVAGGYSEDRYRALFAGIAPASHPRLVGVVMIDEPTDGEYFGGLVAAPVFSRVMDGALRLLDIAPDDLPMADGGGSGDPAARAAKRGNA
ncbi:peptidoglycan D,D-transpeptidase FtsI family protein [Endothiovibrio diazotrophicus]